MYDNAGSWNVYIYVCRILSAVIYSLKYYIVHEQSFSKRRLIALSLYVYTYIYHYYYYNTVVRLLWFLHAMPFLFTRSRCIYDVKKKIKITSTVRYLTRHYVKWTTRDYNIYIHDATVDYQIRLPSTPCVHT